MDDPPPYPGEVQHSIDEKQPLNPSHLYVSMETQEEFPSSTERMTHVRDLAMSSGYDDTSVPHSFRHGPAVLSQTSNAVTNITRDSPEENIADINVSGDFNEFSSPCTSEEHSHVILNEFRNATSSEGTQPQAAYASLRDLTSEQINLAAQSCNTEGACSSAPTKTIEIGAYLRSLQGQNQSSEESTDMAEALPTTKLLSEHEEDRPAETEPKSYLGQQEVSSTLTSYSPETLFSVDDSIVQVIPQG